MMDLALTTYVVFAVLVLICSLLQLRVYYSPAKSYNDGNLEALNDKRFKAFQRQFFLPYFLSLFADWLQGPYVYKLYSSYGFQESQIAFLYVVGFASSAIFGTVAGVLADRYGRRRSSLVFCLIYIFCCLTKISPNFYWLLVGRVMGGVATSLLFSTFESWYIYEHRQKHDFPVQWMSVTFSTVTLCNAFLAIVAGIISNILAETLGFGPLSPFLLAVPVLFGGMLMIAFKWDENYGSQESSDVGTCSDGLLLIFKDKQILILGIIQFLFESVMYMFVFVWTPILDANGKAPLGMIFACFMVCMMIGSSICQLTTSSIYSSESCMRTTLFTGLVSILTCLAASYGSTTNIGIAFSAFLVLEISVGMYFPSISYLRSQIVPESHRATIMNWFRLPMNAITCAGLLWQHSDKNSDGNRQIFAVCSGLLFIAWIVSLRLRQKKTDENESELLLITEAKK